MTEAIRQLLRDQDGVISRRQVCEFGGDDALIRRQVRRREWVLAGRGVYLDHTGEPTWRQRVWIAYLASPGAVLAGRTALAWAGFLPEEGPIQLAVEHATHVLAAPGARIFRVRDLTLRLVPGPEPSRIRFEEALIDVAAAQSSRAGALALLMRAVQERRTTPDRIIGALEGRTRLRHRAWLLCALGDLLDGAFSVLERGYLRRVERAHGLPRAARQIRAIDARVRHRDLEYVDLRVIVELDGKAGHTSVNDRWADLDRDLHAAADGRTTIRLTWRHIDEQPCRTAALVGRALRARGWPGRVRSCGPGCPNSDNGVDRRRMPA